MLDSYSLTALSLPDTHHFLLSFFFFLFIFSRLPPLFCLFSSSFFSLLSSTCRTDMSHDTPFFVFSRNPLPLLLSHFFSFYIFCSYLLSFVGERGRRTASFFLPSPLRGRARQTDGSIFFHFGVEDDLGIGGEDRTSWE